MARQAKVKKTYAFSVVIAKQPSEGNSAQFAEELLNLLAEIISHDQFQMISEDKEAGDG